MRPLVLYENDDSTDEDARDDRDRGGGGDGPGGGGGGGGGVGGGGGGRHGPGCGGESGGRVGGGGGGADGGRVVWEREEDVAHEWSAGALLVAALDEVLASVEKVESDEAGALIEP